MDGGDHSNNNFYDDDDHYHHDNDDDDDGHNDGNGWMMMCNCNIANAAGILIATKMNRKTTKILNHRNCDDNDDYV